MNKNLIIPVFFISLFSNIIGMQDYDGKMLIAQEEELSPTHTILTGILSEFRVVIIEIHKDKAGHEKYSGYSTMRGVQIGARKQDSMSPALAKTWADRLKPIAVKHKNCRDLLTS